MRAIISCRTDISRDLLRNQLSPYNWAPASDAEEERIQAESIRGTMEQEVAELDREQIKGFWFMLRDSVTHAWVHVSDAGAGTIQFRVKHSLQHRLEDAAERLITNLRDIERFRAGGHAPKFKFEEVIRVREAGNAEDWYYGEILPPRTWESARRDKAGEWNAAKWALSIGLLLAFSTIPPIFAWMKATLSDEWATFWHDTLARLSTPALVTAAVSLVAVFARFMDLGDMPRVRWVHPRERQQRKS